MRPTCRWLCCPGRSFHAGLGSRTSSARSLSTTRPDDANEESTGEANPGDTAVLAAAFKRTLRSLLREARRLPDPASRQYVKRHVITRSRSHQDDAVPVHRQQTRLRSARRNLNTLQKANEGYLEQNLKILMHTYGRTGRRRHELLELLTTIDPDHNVAFAPQNPILAGIPSLHPANEAKIPCPTDKHLALIKSQMQRLNPILSNVKRIRRTAPDVAKLNAWQRPMPQVRLINAAKAHWRMLLERTMPPLESKEWERLRGLATGEETSIPLRVSDRKCNDYVARDLVDVLSNHETRVKKLREEKVVNAGGKTKPHMMTARFMRRMWAHVFQRCPKMVFDRDKGKWQVSWGIDALRGARKGRNSGISKELMNIDKE